MSEQIIHRCVEFSSFKKIFFSFKINRALKYCNNIGLYLISKNHLSNFDNSLNLITSDGSSNEIKNSYFLYKKCNKDGSIATMRTYTFMDGKISEYKKTIKQDIIILDLYEETSYLHSYSKDNHYITGYLIKEKTNSKRNKTLIFSNEKVKINVKNINKYETINVVDDFVNRFIM